MMKVILTCLCLILWAGISAQEVIGTSGNEVESGEIRVSQTVGEVVIASAFSGTIKVTQGFQQPFLSSVGIDEVIAPSLMVYPNPASSFLILDGSIEANTTYRLYDLGGRLVRENGVPLDQRIIVNDLSSGVYILTLQRSQQVVATFTLEVMR